MIRALLVDDEPLAREALRDLVQSDGGFTVVGEAGDGAEAVAAIAAMKPDAVFLDVQMPGLDGFGVVAQVGVEKMPLTVFVTAYDQYALKAFEAQALDYILKPFDDLRVKRTLMRIKRQLETPRPSQPTMTVRTAGRVILLRLDEVLSFEARGNHVRVRTATQELLVRQTLKNMEAQMDPDRFVRVHRSAIVNVDHVSEIRPWYTGEYVVVMRDGREITLSRGFRASLPRLRDPRPARS